MRGFTLIETIIYIGLFGILVVGVIASIRPLFTGVERMSERVMVENEIAFVSHVITPPLPQAHVILSPSLGETSNMLTLTTYSGIQYSFRPEGGAILASVASSPWTPLTTSRVGFSDMEVKRVAASGGTPQYIEIVYTVEGTTTAPLRTYLNF